MVGDDQIGAPFGGLVGYVGHGVNGEQDPLHSLSGIATYQPYRVPGGSPRGIVDSFERVGYVMQGQSHRCHEPHTSGFAGVLPS